MTISPRQLTRLQLSEELDKRWIEIQLPMYIIHGSKDRVVDPSASHVLYQSAASVDKKTIKIYGEMKHELLEDPEKDDVLQSIVEWLNSQCIAK